MVLGASQILDAVFELTSATQMLQGLYLFSSIGLGLPPKPGLRINTILVPSNDHLGDVSIVKEGAIHSMLEPEKITIKLLEIKFSLF
jgi:hypothetical protein